ncbi:Trypsin [Popillia japonica]|uniref:Trypsin n=1 Tax=Popillia japonica TaxID=7064 RepID=A0AAW1ITG6_POPJA
MYITFNEIYKGVLVLITCFTFSTRCDVSVTDFLIKYPYQSLVRLRISTLNDKNVTTSQSKETFCTGLIINSAYILTYARCWEYTHYKDSSVTVLFVTSAIDNKNATMMKWMNHESYEQSRNKYDLALIELKDLIQFTHFIHPGVLFHGDTHIVETHLECAIVAWNDSLRTAETIVYFMLLSKVDVTLMKQQECHKKYPEYIPVLCVTPKEPLDLCKMDLGTPLTCGVMNIWVFLGFYTGINTCSSDNDNVFVFRKLDNMVEWVKERAIGAYAIDGTNLNKTKKSSGIPAKASLVQNYLFSSVIFLLGLYYFNRLD